MISGIKFYGVIFSALWYLRGFLHAQPISDSSLRISMGGGGFNFQELFGGLTGMYIVLTYYQYSDKWSLVFLKHPLSRCLWANWTLMFWTAKVTSWDNSDIDYIFYNHFVILGLWTLISVVVSATCICYRFWVLRDLFQHLVFCSQTELVWTACNWQILLEIFFTYRVYFGQWNIMLNCLIIFQIPFQTQLYKLLSKALLFYAWW